jgi:putative peptidoglycan lipid II flippase
MSERFERHALTVTALTVCSRLTGLARDAALSRVFGLTATMDAFNFAFMIPNLFRRLFGEGALSAAFLPVYTQLTKDHPGAARRLAAMTLGLLLLGLGGLAALAEIALGAMVAAGVGAGDTGGVALWLMMLMLPYMPLVCFVAIVGAMLQVHGRFGPTAAAPVILNLCVIIAAVGYQPIRGGGAAEVGHVTWVAAAVMLAGALQVLWSLLALQRSAGRLQPRADRAADPALRAAARAALVRVLTQAWPMFIGLGVLQFSTFLDGLIASYPTVVGPTIFGVDFPLSKGAQSSLSFAQRLYEFPLGVFGIAIATAIFPALSRQAKDDAAFLAILRRGLRLTVFIGLPASLGLMLVRDPLTAVVFQGGDFTHADVGRVSRVLLGYAPAIWAYSMTHVLTRAFYAIGDSMTPVKVAVGVVALNLALNAALIWTPLREAGLAWSTATCAVIQCVILVRVLRRRIGAIVDDDVRRSWLRTAIVTSFMGACVWLVSWLAASDDVSWSRSAIVLAVLVGTGAATLAAAALALRMTELRWAMGRHV